MGFFTDLKEDLAMAVNELMPEDTEEAIRSNEDTFEVSGQEVKDIVSDDVNVSADDFELDKMLENLDVMDMMTEQAENNMYGESSDEEDITEEAITEEMSQEEIVEEDYHTFETAEVEEIAEIEDEETPMTEMTFEEDALLTAVEQEEQNTHDKGVEFKMDNMANRTVSDETAVITQGMVINGDIISEGSMDVIGTIIGNIELLGKLNITGNIQGNSKASEIFADNAQITGEVVSEGSVKIGQSSVIIGNITATSAVIAGAVKGDIDVKGPVILDTSAIVMGNIKSKSVQINNGAVIEGMCSQCYAEINPTSFFDELKKNK